ncbi:MAG TPA: hypothetical protein VFB80_11540 [Pirellulaceae bacterium]|jgi:MoxR-vWA-beta-propeller ternary system protein|nr:hypothetical protein [Pirellulaceae bacterium]
MSTLAAVPLQLAPGGALREPALLETSLDLLCEYALTAPQWRIDRWSFVAQASRRVLVRGSPLPPLPGTHWVETEGICVPAGRSWSPAVEPAVVRQLLGLEPGVLALLREDATWDRINPDDWVRASRSAFRRTLEALPR